MELSAALSDCDRGQILIWKGSCGTKGLEMRSHEKQDEKQRTLKNSGLESCPISGQNRCLNKEHREGREKQNNVRETREGFHWPGLGI